MKTKSFAALGWALLFVVIACGFTSVTSEYGPSQNTQINAALTLQQSEVDALSAAGVGGTLAAANVIVGNDSTNATAMPVIGDVTITQDGTNATTLIASGVIVNADVNASAAIALTKLAAGHLKNGAAASTLTVEYGTCTNAEVVVFANTYASIVYANIEDGHATENAYFSSVTTTTGVAVVSAGLTNKFIVVGIE
jgi:hypothetical protein